MEHFEQRSSSFLDDPVTDISITALTEWSARTSRQLKIPSDLSVQWIELHNNHIYTPEIFKEHFEKINQLSLSSNTVIAFWSAPGICIISPEIVETFNEWIYSVPNPVVIFNSSPGDWMDQVRNQLACSLVTTLSYEYESSIVWQNLANTTTRNKKFLYMGTKDYPNRKFLLSHILNNNLLDQGYVSYKAIWGKGLTRNAWSEEEEQYVLNIADAIDSILPLPVLDDSIEYRQMPRKFLMDSYLNMVTDTFYDVTNQCTFISEKVFNAMEHRQMFIMMTQPNTLKYLKSLGYKTFDDYIDESYDNIENPLERLKQITTSFLDFVNQPIEQIRDIYLKCLPRLEHNRTLLHERGQKFLTTIELELRHAINEKTKTK